MGDEMITEDNINDGILIEENVTMNDETVHNLLQNNDPVTQLINIVRQENSILLSTLRNNGIDIGTIDFEETINGITTTENIYDESLDNNNDINVNECNNNVQTETDMMIEKSIIV